jgi:hypothetical protein
MNGMGGTLHPGDAKTSTDLQDLITPCVAVLEEVMLLFLNGIFV